MISPFVVAVALAAFPIMSLADKPNPADYPKPDALAPANPAWLGTVLQGVPSLPVGTKPLAATDWSKDVTVCPNANQWGLTYDDGPGPLTDDLLGELAKRNAGHQIGIHTWSHPYLSNTPSDQIVAEIVYTAKAIKQVIGVTPRFMRAPYGDIDERVSCCSEKSWDGHRRMGC
ncbi:hypothetical protein BASA61_009169 [Batrachochytrium salamandrivorans]|nr:hypothetical protein BASA61_009169 [Batrachochytrium salamandrivorans]